MKRTFLLLAVALSSAASIYSQTQSNENDGYINAFEADSVVWRSSFAVNNPGYKNPIFETVLYGDTLVAGKQWKIFTFNRPLFNQEGLIEISGVTKGLLRTENRKVIVTPYPGFEANFWIQGETVLFDFSMEVGDYVNDHTIVSSIDSVELNDGKKHKRLHFRYIESVYPSDDYSDIVEGLGGVGYDHFEALWFTPIERDFFTPMCCHVNGELLYMNPVFLNCEGDLVANETVKDISSKASVSFSGGQLRVAFDGEALFDVELYNMQGTMVWQKKNNRNQMFANLENLPTGVYIVRIDSGNDFYSAKILK